MADWDEPQNPTPARSDSAAYSAEITRLRTALESREDDMRAAAEVNAALRTELEAVKREAVEALKPFAKATERFDGYVHDHDDVYTAVRDIKALHLRAARAFVEKHGRDG